MSHLILQKNSTKPRHPKSNLGQTNNVEREGKKRKKTHATKANAAPSAALSSAAEDAAASQASREAAAAAEPQRTSIGGPVDDDMPVNVARRADAVLPLLPHVRLCPA